MRAPGIAAAVTAALGLLVLVVGLAHGEPRSAGSNAVRSVAPVVQLRDGDRVCQRPEIVPEGAATIELTADAAAQRPALAVVIRDAAGRVVTRGRADLAAGSTVRIPLGPVRRSAGGAEICLSASGPGAVGLRGQPAAEGHLERNGRTRPGVLRIAYLRSGSESWFGLAPTIAHRFAQAKTRVAGAWMFWVVLALIAAAVVIGVRAALTAGDVRRVAAACALVAVLNGVTWSLLLPPLQAHDETVHVYYTQRLAETGTPPRPIPGTVLSDEENAVLTAVRLFDVVGNRDGHPPWTEFEDRALDRTLASGLSRLSDGADGGVGVYPPLYYALGVVAYKATPGGSLLDRMEAMRLVSALLAGVAAVFVCLFARVLLPARPWAWAAAGVIAAFQPVFGYMSGAFNPDMAVTAAGAALFYAIARALRNKPSTRGQTPGRGLTPRLGLAIGLALSLGFLSKLAFAGFIPGAALAVLIAMWRSRAWVSGLVAAVAALVPVGIYVLLNHYAWDRPALVGGSAPGGGVTGAVGGGGGAPPGFNLSEALVYIWQVHLPRLPFMADLLPGYPLWDRYFEKWVGRFAWGDYAFPSWVPAIALAVGLVLLAAAVALALRHRAAFVARWPEWLSYAALAGGLLLLLAYTGYDYFKKTGLDFEQGRYLLPLHALYAGIVAAGLRGFGARVGPIVAAVLVVAAAGMSAWAQLLTIARFYG